MKNVSYRQVDITGGFLKHRQELNEQVTMESVYRRFDETGRIGAFRCDWREGQEHKPHVFWDSDVAKWIEAASYILQKHPDPSLSKRVDDIVEQLELHQCEDGYYNSYYNVCEPDRRFTVRSNHELYCAGHLTEAAVAYYEATGKDRFLKAMMRYMDCIERSFITEQTASFTTPGHEEIELALIRLYRCTGIRKYLDMAAFFLNQRGCNAKDGAIYPTYTLCHTQDHAPIRDQHTAEGHCVRALYLYSGMADLALETEDAKLSQACLDLFNDITGKKMYITGASGSTYHGESYTAPYDLPNETAYAETCASIALMFFAERMLEMHKEARYADIVERALYNGVLSGVSLKGDSFFYENPLEIHLANRTRHHSMKESPERLPITQRKEYFDCSCCPPNINRLIASLGGYLYGAEEGAVYVHQFAESELKTDRMHLTQMTNYPLDGYVTFRCEGIETLYIRIPGWCRSFSLDQPYLMEKGYARIDHPAPTVRLRMAMDPELIAASPAVWQDTGCAAVQMGPLVYCMEGIDNGNDIANRFLRRDLAPVLSYDPLFRANRLEINGWKRKASDELYAPLDNAYEPVRLHLIPYFAFANRGESDMRVFIPLH